MTAQRSTHTAKVLAKLYFAGDSDYFDQVEVTVFYRRDMDQRRLATAVVYETPQHSSAYADHKDDINTAVERAGFTLVDDEEMDSLVKWNRL
jgi:uncharacterized protein YneR